MICLHRLVKLYVDFVNALLILFYNISFWLFYILVSRLPQITAFTITEATLVRDFVQLR